MTQSVTSTAQMISVRIQPAVILSIFDQFQRRSELCTGRLIGAIFGTRDEEDSNEGSISVSQAFPIPHSEINDQVNINSEYYRNRAELVKTCYGRSQYILGWYSIATATSKSQQSTQNFALNTSFIHDIFSKEVMKSSPVNVTDAALHLDLVIGEEGGIEISALMASGKEGNVLNFVKLTDCVVNYTKEDIFVLRSLMHSLKSSATSIADAVPFPSAKEFNEACLNEFSQLLTQLKASSSDKELLKHLPDAAAYQKHAEKLRNDLKGTLELVKLLCDQLSESQKFFASN